MSSFEESVEEIFEDAIRTGTTEHKVKVDPKKVMEQDFPKAKPSPTQQEGEQMYSELIQKFPLVSKMYKEVIPKGFEDFPIRVYQSKDWDEGIQSEIPDISLLKGYLPPLNEFYFLSLAMSHGHKVRIIGDAGTGKSVMAQAFSAMVGQPFIRINFNNALEPSDVLGSWVVQEGSMNFVEGDIPRAIRAGATICFDEMSRAPGGINLMLQRLMEKGGNLKINEKYVDNLIIPHGRTRFIVTDNTKGLGDHADRYGSAMIQDVSFMNRFEVTIESNYLPKDWEVGMLTQNNTELAKPLAVKMVKCANLIREGFTSGELSIPFSHRTIENWVHYTLRFRNPVIALRFVYFYCLADDDEKGAVRGYVQTVFSTDYGTL